PRGEREKIVGFGLLARKGTSQAAVLFSQSPGAFPSGACQEKRQRTRRASAHPNLLFCFPAVQDAVAVDPPLTPPRRGTARAPSNVCSPPGRGWGHCHRIKRIAEG